MVEQASIGKEDVMLVGDEAERQFKREEEECELDYFRNGVEHFG